jgi:dTDP-glucose 4,6-dehydratase
MNCSTDASIIVTGGAGFIGSAVVRHFLSKTNAKVVTVDNLTYAGHYRTMGSAIECPRHSFERTDICDSAAMRTVFATHKPSAIIHLAAETHVDRSIDAPSCFVTTNVVGTTTLLETIRHYLRASPNPDFRLVHVSTDEVFGSLGEDGSFDEESRYDPSSPYAASKASADHMVRAWHRTYKLPVIVTNCSNNYGPYQHPEKLIPTIISKCLEEQPIPIYGSGSNVRDWLYVEDHADALFRVLEEGVAGETYNIGGNDERQNLEVARIICDILDSVRPRKKSYRDLIHSVADRPGHDFRYAVNTQKIQHKLGWKPSRTFEQGARETVTWYLSNQDWCETVTRGRYDGRRLGTTG